MNKRIAHAELDRMTLDEIERMANRELGRPEAIAAALQDTPGEIDMSGPHHDVNGSRVE